MASAQHWQRNLMLLNNISFFRAFMVIMPIFVPLMQQYGLSMRDIMLVQSVFAGVLLLCEIPSGYIADRFGRKTCLVIGYAITGFGFTQIIWANSFLEIVLFEVTLGIGFSLFSGADIALAFESEKAMAQSGQNAIARLMSWMNVGEAASALSVFFLLNFDMQWILWLQAIVGWLPFLLCLGLRDAPLVKGTTAPKATKILTIYWQQPTLKLLTCVFIVTMSATYLMTWLNQNLWLHYQIPFQYFALVWGGFSLTVAIASRLSSRIPNSLNGQSIFIWLGGLIALAYSALMVPHWLGVVTAGFMLCLFRGVAAAKIKLEVNNQIDNSYRASMNSVIGASFRMATLLLGPLMGLSVDYFGAIATSQGMVILFAPAIFGLWYLAQKKQTAACQTKLV